MRSARARSYTYVLPCAPALTHVRPHVLTRLLALSFDTTQASRNIQKTMKMHKENTFTLRLCSCKKGYLAGRIQELETELPY